MQWWFLSTCRYIYQPNNAPCFVFNTIHKIKRVVFSIAKTLHVVFVRNSGTFFNTRAYFCFKLVFLDNSCWYVSFNTLNHSFFMFMLPTKASSMVTTRYPDAIPDNWPQLAGKEEIEAMTKRKEKKVQQKAGLLPKVLSLSELLCLDKRYEYLQLDSLCFMTWST